MWEVVKPVHEAQLSFDFFLKATGVQKYSSGLTISMFQSWKNKPYALWFYIGNHEIKNSVVT